MMLKNPPNEMCRPLPVNWKPGANWMPRITVVPKRFGFTFQNSNDREQSLLAPSATPVNVVMGEGRGVGKMWSVQSFFYYTRNKRIYEK